MIRIKRRLTILNKKINIGRILLNREKKRIGIERVEIFR
jgi:hypothetical protein